jgi:hypothetical protein
MAIDALILAAGRRRPGLAGEIVAASSGEGSIAVGS